MDNKSNMNQTVCSKEDFEKSYIALSGITALFYNTHFVTLPCHCDYSSCCGWACVSNDPIMITAHKELYG